MDSERPNPFTAQQGAVPDIAGAAQKTKTGYPFEYPVFMRYPPGNTGER
jgi:hypothetical protein